MNNNTFKSTGDYLDMKGISETSPLIDNNIYSTQTHQSHNNNGSPATPALSPYPITYYSAKKPWSCMSSVLPFALGTIFGTAIWPILFTIMTYGIISQSKHLPNQPPNKFNSSQELVANKTRSSITTQKAIKFEDIAGMAEAKAELSEIVDFLRNPEPYKKIGARLPKGVLLAGPPGSGKTMLANAVATEAGLPYLYISGSEFVEIFVGQGAKRVRQLFNAARSVSPCVIFIDELDAVGSIRDSGSSLGGHREHDQTLNQMLVELDGFTSSNGIIVLAATNRIDSLDPALLRPGRFDRIVQVGLPDIAGRKAIIKMYLTQLPFEHSEDIIDSLAKMTSGFSGADLENMINEAALLAARSNKLIITEDDLYNARDKVSMGPERLSLIIPERQRILTSYHEAGHALVAYYLQPNSDPIHQITIVSRGNALGYVEQIPIEDRYGYTKAQLEAKIAVTMGGRAAEFIVFGEDEITSGASGDIQTATYLANKMVREWGMSSKVGPLNYISQNFPFNPHSTPSSTTSKIIEDEVKNFISIGQKKAEKIIRKHRLELDLIAQTLLEKETVKGDELREMLENNEGGMFYPFSFFNKYFFTKNNENDDERKLA